MRNKSPPTVPLHCTATYPCNPWELVAKAVSAHHGDVRAVDFFFHQPNGLIFPRDSRDPRSTLQPLVVCPRKGEDRIIIHRAVYCAAGPYGSAWKLLINQFINTRAGFKNRFLNREILIPPTLSHPLGMAVDGRGCAEVTGSD